MLKAIWTFDHKILELDRMNAVEATVAEGAYLLSWILGVDENENLFYYDPTTGETVTLDNLKGKIMTRDDLNGGAGVVAEEQPAAPEQPEQPAAPETPEPQVPAAPPEPAETPETPEAGDGQPPEKPQSPDVAADE